MSLQVWLPLNGDLNNYGLGQVKIISGTPSYKQGKIGINSLNLNSRIYFSCKELSNLQTFSVCFWAITENSSTLTTNWQDLIGFTDVSSSGTNGTFRWETCYGSTMTNYIGIHWHDNATNALVNGSAVHSKERSKWCHCCVVFDLINQKLYSYTNGNLIATHTHLGGRFNTEGKFYLGETNNIEGRIQDVRFYDHALSPKEVKEISKGLVLHYPLKDRYIEDTSNINSFIEQGISNTCYNGAKGTYSYGTNTDMYKISGEFKGRKCTKVYMGTAGNSAWPYVFFSPFHPANGSYKTLSFDYYPTSQDKINFYTYGGGAALTSTVNGITINNATMTVKLNQWNHITVTLLGTSSSTSGWGYMKIGTNSHTSTTTDYWLFANVQIEEKDHATPFTTSSRFETIIYDCSGYSNNGTKLGTIICDSDTPRYTTSYKMVSSNVGVSTNSGMTTIYSNNGLTTPSEMTITFWLKPIRWNYQDSGLLSTTMNSYPTDYTTSAINQYDSNFRFNASDGTSLYISATSLVNDSLWHYYSFVFDGINVKVYKDGTLTNLGKSFSSTKTLGSFNKVFIGLSQAGGAWRQTSAYWSDFRIYATALNEKDILELYQTSFQIDNNGNLYAYELIEQE